MCLMIVLSRVLEQYVLCKKQNIAVHNIDVATAAVTAMRFMIGAKLLMDWCSRKCLMTSLLFVQFTRVARYSRAEGTRSLSLANSRRSGKACLCAAKPLSHKYTHSHTHSHTHSDRAKHKTVHTTQKCTKIAEQIQVKYRSIKSYSCWTTWQCQVVSVATKTVASATHC